MDTFKTDRARVTPATECECAQCGAKIRAADPKNPHSGANDWLYSGRFCSDSCRGLWTGEAVWSWS